MRNIMHCGVLLLVAATVATTACKKEEKPVEDLETEDDGKPAVDPALAKAVAAASA